MKTRNMLLKLFFAAFALCGIAVLLIGWGAGDVGAADHRDRRGFGLVSLNPGQVARLNVFSLRINENQMGEQRSDTEEARPRRITIAFDVYAPGSENARQQTTNSDNTCASTIRFVN